MKINKSDNIPFFEKNNKTNYPKKNTNAKQKQVEISANEALAAQGKAIVSFGKNSIPKKISSLPELTDEEFEKKQVEFLSKVFKLPTNIRQCIKGLNLNKYNIFVAEQILSDKRLYTNKDFMEEAEFILEFSNDKETSINKFNLLNKVLANEEILNRKANLGNIGKLLNYACTSLQTTAAEKILDNRNLYTNKNLMPQAGPIIGLIETDLQLGLINKVLDDEEIYNNPTFMFNAVDVLDWTTIPYQAAVIDKILSNKILFTNEDLLNKVRYILFGCRSNNNAQLKINLMDRVVSDERLHTNEEFMSNLGELINYTTSKERYDKIISLLDNKNILPQQVLILYTDEGEISPSDLLKLNEILGLERVSKLSQDEAITAAKFVYTFGKNNISELSANERKKLLNNLVSSNCDLFIKSDIIRKYFPILPKNQEEYCEILPQLISSLDLGIKPLTQKENEQFNVNLHEMADTLEKLSDDEFNNIKITQKYSKESFIVDVLSVIKDLPVAERQKVYACFGFELHLNAKSQVMYSITGYPALNNNSDESDIQSEATKQAIENVQSIVEKYLNNNPVICNNKELEEKINKVIVQMPELRPLIGKIQAGMNGTLGSHDFDIFQHSLKVVQKIVQNPEYKELSESDKKVMLLTALLHDITKREGSTDNTHANFGSIDASFIIKKFNMTNVEQMKLINLIKHHEWLAFVNSSYNDSDLSDRITSVAYDLRYDNLFDMSLIFTHADLKAVRKDNSFHSQKEGRGRTDYKGENRSFGESADFYAKRIKKVIYKLKATQPLLPVTKIPNTDTINKAIKTVHSDGSTNIKGVYKDKDGLIILKYNEIGNEDWGKIGFSNGSISKGIPAKTSEGDDVSTGNIKFFVHGLDFADQLVKFDVFSSANSDAILSASYAERPESKYKFFRPQGIILDCDTKYIHGGGANDIGSGTKKTIKKFKHDYLDEEAPAIDRTFISELIKEYTGMNNEEYIQFVKRNEDKSITEIEPPELRDVLVKAFSTIKSTDRENNRQYNEMFISNPKPPMAVFAYNTRNEKIKNPVSFLNDKRNAMNSNYCFEGFYSTYERTYFLREYALKHNIPFVIFGD